MAYKPTGVDTSGIVVDRDLAELEEQLARNAHENWARLRIAEGWRFGPERNDARKEHPNLVSFDQLAESEKEYDRQAAVQTIKTLLAKGYSIQRAKSNTASSEVAAALPLEPKPADVLRLLNSPTKLDLALAQALWRTRDPATWASDPETYRLLGERTLKLGEPLAAYDVIAEGMKAFPQDVRLQQLFALALARSGASESANSVLMGLYEAGHRDEETVGVLARSHKDLARESTSPDEANQHLRRAYNLYTQSYRATGGYWSAINAATLAVLLGDRHVATTLARSVREECQRKLVQAEVGSPERYWLVSTLGEASLMLEDWPAAKDWYGRAFAEGSGNWGSLATTRHSARLLLKHLGGNLDWLEQIFQFPSVVVFAGHMIDRSDRQVPRFPAQIEPAVKNAIQDRINKFDAGFGYASAACGADLLFHEALLEKKAESHVILPYEKELFAKDSVDIISAGNWRKRFEKVMDQAVDVQEISKQCKTHSLSYEFANQIMHGVATMRAQQLETKLIPLAVWDGRGGDGRSGTASTVQRWRKLGLKVEIIDLQEIFVRECPEISTCTNADGALSLRQTEPALGSVSSEILAMLFADAEGFSKLTDEEVPRFVEHFFGLVGGLIARLAHKPLTKNTWGDGLYFVFSDVVAAGLFALDLRDSVRGTDWSSKGLPDLHVRIGLHAGPVHACIDPVTQQVNYIGTHVSRAARIEPITPSDQVYSSQAFAALAAAQGIREFRCDYVGQTSLAKQYGTFPTYVVLRRHSAASEGSHSITLD